MEFALEINVLTKIYNSASGNTHKALNEVTLNIKKGSIFGLLGPNGAGKSTLINIIGTVVNKTSGSIKIMGYDLDKDTIEAKRSIGIVPQEINFDPFFTPLELLMLQQGLYGLKPNKEQCMGFLEFMGLEDKANSYLRSLSGGMKRRLLIAKAMVHSPSVLVLDEPTAGVDVELRKKIWDGVIDLNKKGTTIILTTHYLEEAEELCKEIAIINKGKVVANDKTSVLLNDLGSKSIIVETNNLVPEPLPLSLQKLLTKKNGKTLYFNYSHDQDTGIILNELAKSNIGINYVKTEESHLEEVFLKLTN